LEEEVEINKNEENQNILNSKIESEKLARQEQFKKRKEEPMKKSQEILKNDPLKSSPIESIGVKPIREEVVSSSANFLNHPKVKSSPQEQKISFLQKKGLTQEEIDEALKRSNTSAAITPVAKIPTPTQSGIQSSGPVIHQQPNNYLPPNYTQLPPGYQLVPQYTPSSYSTRFGFVATVASCITFGIGLAVLVNKYFSKDDSENLAKLKKMQEEKEIEWKKEEKRKQSLKLLEEISVSLKDMQTQNIEIKEIIKSVEKKDSNAFRQPISSFPVDNSTKMVISEMQAQLNSLKAQVVDMKSTTGIRQAWSPSSITQKSSIPAWQNSANITNSTVSEDRIKLMSSKKDELIVTHPYSNDFMKIAEMVKNGQTPPGIKEINDKPEDPNVIIEKGELETPTKPWIEQKHSENPIILPTNTQNGTSNKIEYLTDEIEPEKSENVL